MSEISVSALLKLSERELADQIVVSSSASAQEVFTAVRMPAEVQGKRILDDGAGASNAVAELVKMGADAHAVDPRYDNDLRSLLNPRLRLANYLYGFVIPKKGFSKGRREALKQFQQSFKQEPDRYKRAYATMLPYDSNWFDIVYSRNLIFSFLDVNKNLLMRAVYESLRVTKPGGTVRLYPYMDVQANWPNSVNQLRIQNNELLAVLLKSDSAVANVLEETFEDETSQTRVALIIEKAY